MELREYIVDTNTSILEALNKINENGREIVFVCDHESMFYGTVTDGDVRRHLLNGGEVRDGVALIMNKKPYVIYYPRREDVDYLTIMRDRAITAIPIIDENGRLVDAVSVYDNRQQIPPIDVPVVIMAGGKGTRLKPYTDVLPKPLLPIGNKTVTERIMDCFHKNGCSKFFMIVNYKKDFIKTYFQYVGEKYNISFIDESEYRGTGGDLYF